jgi:hypothetical protein
MGARQAGSSEDRILLARRGFLPTFSRALLSFLLDSDLFSSHQRVSIDHATRHPFAAFRSLGGDKTSSHLVRLPQKIEFGPTHPPRNSIMLHCQMGMQSPQNGEDGWEDRQFSRECDIFFRPPFAPPGGQNHFQLYLPPTCTQQAFWQQQGSPYSCCLFVIPVHEWWPVADSSAELSSLLQ